MNKILLSVAIAFATFSAYAQDHVFSITPTVQFVYTDVPCKTMVPEEGFNAKIVEAYALDLAKQERAEGCAAIYVHPKAQQEVVQFRLTFVNEHGEKVLLDPTFLTSRFKVLEKF